jgi:hypothetical protein
VYYMGGIVEHPGNLPDPLALRSADAEYNESRLAYQVTLHLHTTLNELEDITIESKEDKPVGILLDNKSAVDMSVSFKDNTHSGHILHRWHCAISVTESLWHNLTRISNVAQVADIIMKSILPRKGHHFLIVRSPCHPMVGCKVL